MHPVPREAAIVAVGTELTLGLRLDTNTRDAAALLSRAGHSVAEAVTTGDDVDVLASTLERLCSSYALVVVTGGLGPTHDDITRDAASRALGVGLAPDPEMEHWLATIASRHGEPAAAAQIYRQAALLQGAEIIRPTSGTAPGQIVPTPAGRLVLLPGPPHEMMPMLREALVEHDTPVSIGIRCAGITESDAQVRAERIIHDLPGISLTVLASPSLVDVILVDVGAGEAVLETAAASIEAALGEHVYGREDTTLAEAVLDRARLAGTTIGVAESCTGGMLAAALTDVPGASDAFCGGLVAYSNRVKTALLGVSRDTLGRHGAVSAEVAQEMALGAADALGTDITLSVTGIAGPAGGSDDKPVGLVWFGMARGGTTTAFDHRFPGDRSRIRTRAVVAALNALRHTIEV